MVLFASARRRAACLFAAALAAAYVAVAPASAQSISGSGSSFVQPLLNQWSQSFLRSQWTAESQPSGGLDYEAVGSQAGVMRIKERAVDFGATEIPLSADELRRYGVTQFPIIIGGVTAAVNVPELKDATLNLSGEILADIYLGKVARWSDLAIRELNPGLQLPDAAITPIRRTDGSGTTATFTTYLTQASAAWRPIGAGLNVAWPVGASARGNMGVAEMVRRTPYAIGYVDLATARRAKLATAAIKNPAGAFVAPSPKSLQAAVAMADWSTVKEPGSQLVNAPGELAYPIVAATFVVVPADRPASVKTAATIDFLTWGFERGAAEAEDLGYVPLPAQVVSNIRDRWRDQLGLAPALLPKANFSANR